MHVSVRLKRKDANGNGNWYEVNVVYDCTISEYLEKYHCPGDDVVSIKYIDAPISL